MQPPRAHRVIRLTYAVSFVLSIALGGAAAVGGQFSATNLAVLTGVVVAGWLLLVALQRRGRPAAWFVSLAVLNALIVVPELALRAVDFRYESGVEFGYPRPTMFVKYVRDPELFWKFDPTKPDVNAMGFPGPDIEVPKPAGTYRILFLGDSCTYKGPRPYPAVAQERLNEARAAGREVECVSLAIPGYSSHQGRILAEQHGARMQPDLAVVYYGWNDHWLAYGARDAVKKIAEPSAVRDTVEDLTEVSRLMQLFSKLGGMIAGSGQLGETRVTEDEYRANLQAIAAVFGRLRVPVVFITAPTTHPVFGVPRYLIDYSFAENDEILLERHARYNDIVREVARADGCHLLDLDRDLAALPEDEQRVIFMSDGIHFLEPGRELVGAKVAEYLRARFEL